MSKTHRTGPKILQRADHPISRKNISRNTLKVLERLDRGGYKAFLVGGGVRDLMLGGQPKDFDVSTDARPGDIRKLFRNSRVIGRRFRLVHVYFRDGIVEVATFRRQPDARRGGAGDDLLITSDNTYGTPREDAFRRDFTINALFYNIADFSVIDYVDGYDDLQAGVVRAIGDPDVRFQEDPVRMLRACEFAGRLRFTIEAGTEEGIRRQREELYKASSARVTEEIIQLLRCRHAADALQWMLDLQLTDVLLPETAAMLEAEKRGLGSFRRVFSVVDSLIDERREIEDTTLLATLLLSKVVVARDEVESRRGRPMSRRQLSALARETAEPFASRFMISKARAEKMAQALALFFRLCEPELSAGERTRIAGRVSFPAALTLFEILVKATGEGREALAEWIRQRPKAAARKGAPARGRRRRRRRSRPPG